jgi:hypothetical protein
MQNDYRRGMMWGQLDVEKERVIDRDIGKAMLCVNNVWRGVGRALNLSS